MSKSALSRLLVAAFLAVALAGPSAAEPIKFARYPHVSQGKLVFSYHGDIWIANENGSNPTRLTAHVARDTFPRLSPDGKLGRVHERPLRQRRRVRRSGDRRRAEAAHVQHDRRHRPELDARRQGDHLHDAARHQPLAQPALRRADRRQPAARRWRWTAACRA